MVLAAYESPWYEASEGFKRSIRIMVVRSMKSFRLTGGKLYVMSLDTFVVVRCLLPSQSEIREYICINIPFLCQCFIITQCHLVKNFRHNNLSDVQ
jgi:7tm Odorant receptor.